MPKVTDLSSLASFDGDETIYVVDDDDGTPTSKKATIEALAAYVGGSFDTVKAYRNTSTQAISTATHTAVQLNAESFDAAGYHDNATNNTRFTVPSGKGGTFLLTGQVDIDPNGTGFRQATIFKNGIVGDVRLAQSSPPANSIGQRIQVQSGPVSLAAGDYVELAIYQSSGGSLNVNPGDGYTWFSLVRLGA